MIRVRVERDHLNEHRRRVKFPTPVVVLTGATHRPIELTPAEVHALLVDAATVLRTAHDEGWWQP